MSPDGPPHRKRVRHYHEPGHCHELTFSCVHRRPLLNDDSWREMLSEAIDRANERHGYNLAAFVFMPEHVHLLVIPDPTASTIDELLKAIKRPFSFRIKRLLEAANDPRVVELTVRQRPGVTTFRFWQEGPGYDRNITSRTTLLETIDYIHRNPVRRRLVEQAAEWPWSSVRWYEGLVDGSPRQLPRLERLPVEFLA